MPLRRDTGFTPMEMGVFWIYHEYLTRNELRNFKIRRARRNIELVPKRGFFEFLKLKGKHSTGVSSVKQDAD